MENQTLLSSDINFGINLQVEAENRERPCIQTCNITKINCCVLQTQKNGWTNKHCEHSFGTYETGTVLLTHI